jgi:hypothetical protein
VHWVVARLSCKSMYLTPGLNSRLWSRMTWAVASGALPGLTVEDWLDSYESGDPLVVVGDLIPQGAMPVPAGYRAKKWDREPPAALPYGAWQDVVSSGSLPADLPRDAGALVGSRDHVSISRSNGKAADGALYSHHGWYAPNGFILYALVHDMLTVDDFKTLLDYVCKEGWGIRRNVGYGAIARESCEVIDPPAAPSGWAMALGHIHPTEDLPAGWWRWTGVSVVPHDPDSRGAIIAPDRTTNHPLHRYHYTTMLAPGATFAYDGDASWHAGTVLRYLVDGKTLYHYGMSPLYPVAQPGEVIA